MRVLMILLILLMLIDFAHAASQAKRLCLDDEMAEKVRTVMLQGVDDALRRQVGMVFKVWMRDLSDQPGRARAGMRNAVLAYIGSREAAQNWSPPLCRKPS